MITSNIKLKDLPFVIYLLMSGQVFLYFGDHVTNAADHIPYENLGMLSDPIFQEGGLPMWEHSSLDTLNAPIGEVVQKPLCRTETNYVQFSDDGYVFNPQGFTEELCTKRKGDKLITTETQMCHFPGFECIQKYRPMTVTKRKRNSNIWEIFEQEVAYCECMYLQRRIT